MNGFPTKRIVFCSSCENKGKMEEVASYDHVVHDVDEYGNDLVEYSELNQLLCCPICDHVILLNTPYDERSETYYLDSEYCYPHIITDFLGVPEKIKTAFESACATKGIDPAICVISLRRTLEMICKDKSAVGYNLKKKIDDLVSRSVLPSAMADVCIVVRRYGNEGAHGDELKLSSIELDHIIRYVSTVIEYTYSLPLRVSMDFKKLGISSDESNNSNRDDATTSSTDM